MIEHCHSLQLTRCSDGGIIMSYVWWEMKNLGGGLRCPNALATDLHQDLYWLPIRQRFIYKLSVLTYTALHTGQPYYLADLIYIHEPSRCLRFTNCHLLAVPSCVKSSFASRAFCVSSPNNWNSLPLHIRSSDSLATFQSRLKSHLFSSAYHV